MLVIFSASLYNDTKLFGPERSVFMKRLDNVNYLYKSLSVPGGGFVTGFVFHPAERLMYARTDIGGIYGFNFEKEQWFPLSDYLTEYERHLTQPLSIAIAPENPAMLFAMCGNKWFNRLLGKETGKASLLISENRGRSFTEIPVPFSANGNSPARGSAERLAYRNGRLFYGSQGDGLWTSHNLGKSWERLSFPENNIAFVFAHPKHDILIVSCTGETNACGSTRGHTLYVSYDYGSTFEKLTAPLPLNDERCDYNGFVADGIACYGDKIYITFTHSIKTSFGEWNSFACDSGGGFDGRAYVYEIRDGRAEFYEDITPVWEGFSDRNSSRRLPFGLGGIDVYENNVVICSVGGRGDGVFISRDGGKTYDIIKSTDTDRFEIDVSYQNPEYNGGRVPLHWMSNLRIDPQDPDFAVFTTGTGPFAVKNITSGKPYIKSLSLGMEETVHLNIYGIPKGKNKVIDIIGDLGGFAFRELDKPCENSFADENNHRYITCINADFVPANPDIFVSTARGNWTGQTKGGVILTRDGGDSFRHIGYPEGISEKLDGLIEAIKKPNTNSGWTAISADGKIILWTLAEKWRYLPAFGAVRYDTETESFTKIKVYDCNGQDISDTNAQLKLFSDRTDSSLFYGFGDSGQLYISRDKGESFTELIVPEKFPKVCMSGFDGFKNGEIRFHPSKKGVCLAALAEHGLWRLSFGDSVTAERLTDEGDFVKSAGFGAGNSEDVPALYISGTLFGEYGFWRSFDEGESWAKINNENQMFGQITSMDGDFRKKGRVYIATGCRGALYGEETE